MPFCQMNELCDSGEDYQDPREIQDLVNVIFGADDEEPPSTPPPSSSPPFVLFPESPEEEVPPAVPPSPPQSPQSSSPSPSAMEVIPWSQSEDEGSSSQEEEGPSISELPEVTLQLMTSKLLAFLLLKYRAKEPTTKAEMLSSVITEHQEHFPKIFSRALLFLPLVFGVDVKEVDGSDTYVLATILDLTYDGMEGDLHSIPKAGLLVLILCVIAMEEDCAPEHKVWEVLSNIGVHDGIEHYICGEPRELITKVWVQEQYVEYRQVTGSYPVRYEFLWGPRAHAETTKLKVLEFLLKHTTAFANLRQSQS